MHDDSTTTRHTSGHSSPEFDITLGREFDHFTGLLHIGQHDGRPHIQGSLIYRNDDDRHYGYDRDRHSSPHYGGRYGSGHYYHHYNPFNNHHEYGNHYPWYGYSYSSLYHHRPVVYRFYDPEYVYFDDDDDYVNEITIINNSSDSKPYYASSAMGPPAPRMTIINNPAAEYAVIDDKLNGYPIEQGGVAFASGDYEEAKSYFAKAMLSDERDGYAKLLYAMSGFAVGEFDLASVALRRALMTTDLLIDRPLDVRKLYKDLHQFDMHMDRLKRYVADHFKDRDTRFLLGYLNYATGRQEPAVAIFGTLSLENQDDMLSVKLLRAVSLAKPQKVPSS